MSPSPAGSCSVPAPRPWRFTATDYEAAVYATRDPDTPPHQLTGAPVATAWDPDLATAMLREGVAVHEERVTDVLLADLTRPD